MAVVSDTVLQDGGIAPECGEYLEYDPDFLALQQAAVGKSEQQFGDTIIPAESPDWNQVHKLGQELLARSLDIRVLILMARAGLERQGLPAWVAPLRLLSDGLARHWEHIHPRLEIDGEQDPMPRMNALAELGDVAGMARTLRSTVLLQDAGIALTIREAEAILEGSARSDGTAIFPGGKPRLTELLRNAAAEQEAGLQALLDAQEHLEHIAALVREKLGESWVPDLAALTKPLTLIAHAARAGTASLAFTEAEQDAGRASPPAPAADAERQAAAPAARPVSWKDVAIQSREEAALLLEKARVYFEVHESSHPAPLLIRRVEQLLPLDFYQLVHQLAPQGGPELDVLMPRKDARDS